MFTVIFYDYGIHTGCIVVDCDVHYSNARKMLPIGAKYKGSKKIEKIDLKIGTRFIDEVNIK